MDARLRALQPAHVSAYLTYALCDLRQTKRRSTTFQTIGVDLTSTIGSVGELVRYISEMLAEKFQQGLVYLESLKSEWLASLSTLPNLQTLLGLSYKLYKMADDVRAGSVADLLTTFFGTAASSFQELQGSEGGSMLSGAIAQLTVTMGDFIARFADTAISVLKPLFQWVIRLASVVYDKFIQLTNLFGKVTAHVVESLFLAGSEPAINLFYFIFAAGMELPKFASIAKSELENYLKGVALKINGLLPSFVPRIWNAAQWIMETEWVTRLAYYLKLPFARVYELISRITAYVQRLFVAMGRLALSYFNEIFGQLGHRIMQIITPLLQPFTDFLNKEKTVMATLGLPEARLREPMSAAQELLDLDKSGRIQLTPESKLRLQESIDVIQTFFKDMKDKQDARFRAAILEPASLYNIIQKKAGLLKTIARNTDLTKIQKTDEMDELVKNEFQMSLEDFTAHYENLQGQIESALVLAVMELEEASTAGGGQPSRRRPTVDILPENLRRRRPGFVDPAMIQTNTGGGGTQEATHAEIVQLKIRIAALNRLIEEEKIKVGNAPVYRKLARLEDYSLRELGAQNVVNAMYAIRARAQLENNESWQQYALQLEQVTAELTRKEAGLKARISTINWLAVIMSLAIGAGLLYLYYRRISNEKEIRDKTQARIKDYEFEKFTNHDPFLAHVREKWEKSDRWLSSETDESSIGVTRMNNFQLFLRDERLRLAGIDATTADFKTKQEVEELGKALWKSFLHDSEIALKRLEENEKDKTAGVVASTWKSLTTAWKSVTGTQEGSPSYEKSIFDQAWQTKRRVDYRLGKLRQSEEEGTVFDYLALPTSFVEVAQEFKPDKFMKGPAGYLETAVEKLAAIATQPPKDEAGWFSWFKKSQDKDDQKDSATVPFFGHMRYLADVQRLMAWRLDTLDTTINLYKNIQGAPPGLVGRVFNALKDGTSAIMEETAELVGVSNVKAEEALDFTGGGAFKNLNVTVQRINPMNYIKLMAYYEWVGFTAALIGWIIGSIIFLFCFFIIAAVFYRDVALAVAQVSYLLHTYVVPWAKFFLTMNLSAAFAYWSSRIFTLGVIYNIFHTIYFGTFSKINGMVGGAVGSTLSGIKTLGGITTGFVLSKFTNYEANNRRGFGDDDVPVIRQRSRIPVMGGGGGWHEKSE